LHDLKSDAAICGLDADRNHLLVNIQSNKMGMHSISTIEIGALAAPPQWWSDRGTLYLRIQKVRERANARYRLQLPVANEDTVALAIPDSE